MLPIVENRSRYNSILNYSWIRLIFSHLDQADLQLDQADRQPRWRSGGPNLHYRRPCPAGSTRLIWRLLVLGNFSTSSRWITSRLCLKFGLSSRQITSRLCLKFGHRLCLKFLARSLFHQPEARTAGSGLPVLRWLHWQPETPSLPGTQSGTALAKAGLHWHLKGSRSDMMAISRAWSSKPVQFSMKIF